MWWFYVIVLCILLASIVYLGYLYWGRSQAPIQTASTNKIERVQPPTKVIQEELRKVEERREDLTADQLYTLAETYQYGKYGKPTDLGRAVRLFEESREKGKRNRDIGHIGKCHMALGRLYKDSGVPEARKAIREFLKAIGCGYECGALEIGKIYMYGLHPYYLPDKLMAGKIFNVLSHGPRFSDHLRAVCAERAKEINRLGYTDLDNIPEAGREYYTLPYTVIEDMSAAFDSCETPLIPCQDEKVAPILQQQRPLRQRHQNRTIDQQEDIQLQNALWGDLVTRHILDIIPQQNVKSDSQNVHSSTVQNAVKNKLDFIEKSGHLSHNFEDNKRRFLDDISNITEISPEDRENIGRVLESLKDTQHSRYDKSEADIFNTVWSRINNPVNKDRRKDMVAVLAQNVASGVEHDVVVCSTGKIVRIVGALDGMDAEPLPELKPEWAINEEIAQSAVKVREDVLAAASPAEKVAYEALDPNDRQTEIVTALTTKMREQLTKKCEGEYCNTNIMSKESLDLKLGDYLESF
jgi:hypothetical protein